MLDRAVRSTVRNFSTLFLVCMVVMLPLETGYAFVHRDVIEVREITPFIEELPDGQRIKGVGSAEIDAAERDRLILNVVEAVLVPLLLVAAARRVLERDRAGVLPTATDAYVHGLTPYRPGPLPAVNRLGAVALALAFSVAVGALVWTGGKLIAELFPDRLAFVMLGLMAAAARSLALPWFLVAWIEAAEGREARRPPRRASPFASPPAGGRRGQT